MLVVLVAQTVPGVHACYSGLLRVCGHKLHRLQKERRQIQPGFQENGDQLYSRLSNVLGHHFVGIKLQVIQKPLKLPVLGSCQEQLQIGAQRHPRNSLHNRKMDRAGIVSKRFTVERLSCPFYPSMSVS